MRREFWPLFFLPLFVASCDSDPERIALIQAELASLKACAELVRAGFRPILKTRDRRFLGKVQEDTARCRGGEKAVMYRDTPWIDWTNYWAAGNSASRAPDFIKRFRHIGPNGRGIDGALIDLEYERIELIQFNLLDNYTYKDYVRGRDGVEGQALTVWKEMRLPIGHPRYEDVGGDGGQLCKGELIRHRTLTGICNDIRNPLMGSTNTVYARNVQFESTFPRLSEDELARNRHGDRLGLLKPDPQVISRKLFTRKQSRPDICNGGDGLPGHSKEAHCDYKKAPFFNVLAAFWIQFMNHDWFSHLVEGHNTSDMMRLGCEARHVDGVEMRLTQEEIERFGCRPDDEMEKAYVEESDEPGTFEHAGKKYLMRAHKTFRNTVTAWWDGIATLRLRYGLTTPGEEGPNRSCQIAHGSDGHPNGCRQEAWVPATP